MIFGGNTSCCYLLMRALLDLSLPVASHSSRLFDLTLRAFLNTLPSVVAVFFQRGELPDSLLLQLAELSDTLLLSDFELPLRCLLDLCLIVQSLRY